MSDHQRIWLAERPRLLGLAYTVTGSWQDAEDVVSEAWLRLDGQSPEDLTAWLTTVVSRLALDVATTAAKRREACVGPWLLETVLEKAASDESPQNLVVLAEVVGTTASATRQRLRRARASLGSGGEEDLPVTADRATLDRLASSLNNGDLEVLVEQLSEGCVLWTDSGGLTRAARNPIHGQERVTRFLAGLIAKYGMPELCVVDAVGGPVVHAASSDMERIITLEVVEGRITGLQIQQNPGKIVRP
jgi:RNA polymerase sigma-70 factor (ECF subfamily)